MKRIVVVLLFLLIILSMSQIIFAKGSMGLTIGYVNEAGQEDYPYGKWTENGFRINLSGEYFFTNKFSLAGNVIYEHLFGSDNYDREWKYFSSNVSLFAKYKILDLKIIDVSLQAGLADHFTQWLSEVDSHNSFIIGLGAYITLRPVSKINIYTDLKFPIAIWGEEVDNGFFKLFLYDIKAGVTYDITSKINLGVEFNISTINYGGIVSSMDFKNGAEGNFSHFSIGAKLGYNF